MSIQINNNFDYKGNQPNFERDRFETLELMRSADERSLDNGHISYCEETGKHYVFNENNDIDVETGKWRLLIENPENLDTNKQDKTDNALNTTDKTVVGAINEINDSLLDNVTFSADYKNIIINRKSGLNPYTIPIASIINNAKIIELNDVDSTDIGNGKTLVYDGATQKHKYVSSTGTDELVKMDSTTDAKYLSDLIDKSTVVNDNGVLKVKKLDGQEVTIAEINHLKGLTMNVMDLVNAFANGGVKVYERTIPTYADLLALDRSGFIDGIKYFVYVQSDETHDGAKTTYICDKNSTSYFCISGDHRDFTTNPIDLVNEVTGKLGTSNIDVDALWKLLTINDTYKTLTAKDEVFGTHGAKALYDELVADIGNKANTTDLTTHTSDTNIHITTAERTKWNKVDGKVDKTSILSTISSTPSDDKLLSEKAINDTLTKKLDLTGGTMTGVLTINNNNPAINLSLQGKSTDKVAEDIRFVDRNGLTRSCVRGNFSALELGQRTLKDGSKWYDGSALLLNDNGSFNLRASDSNGGNRKSLIGTSTDLKWDGNKVITEDQLYRYIPYFPKTIQFGLEVSTTSGAKWVKIFEFTPNEYSWNGGNFIITFSSLNPLNSYYSFGEYELIWKCETRGTDGITDVYLNQIISKNGDVCHTRFSALCVGISENNKTVGLYAFLGLSQYQTMLATIISGGSRYENNQSAIGKWINIDKPTVGLEEQPTFSKANYYSLADNLGGWTYTATKLPVLNYTDVE